MDIGSKIKSYRKKNNLTLKELSFLTDIAQSHLSYIEANKVNPSIDILLRICNALKINLLDILPNEYTNKSLSPEINLIIDNIKDLDKEKIDVLLKLIKFIK